jgi:hypothetical protein
MSALVKRKCKCGGNQHEWYKIVDGKSIPFWLCFHCGIKEEKYRAMIAVKLKELK